MKGIVFSEFLDMAGQAFGEATIEDVITAVAPASGGAYTAVGTYPHQEMVDLLVRLSEVTGVSVPDLLRSFGNYLFGRFALLYPNMVSERAGAFGMMRDLDSVIHVEVRKLYRDAELPSFRVLQDTDETLSVEYCSTRHLADFALGLIEGCIRHYGEAIAVEMCPAPAPGPEVIFRLQRLRPAAHV